MHGDQCLDKRPRSSAISRRRWLCSAAAGAAGAACWPLGTLCAGQTEPIAVAAGWPDRSAEAPTAPVAIERCESFAPQVVRQQLEAALDLIGGVKSLVENKTVTVKLNLTGKIRDVLGRSAQCTYHTHPNVVAALCAVLHDAGARRIVLAESFYYREPPEEFLSKAGWDVAAIKSAGGHRVTFENTRNRGRWPGYARLSVPWGGFLYADFEVSPCYEKTDVFISLAKMKDHGTAGITLSIKNLFGIPPLSLYGGDAPNEDSLTARVQTLHTAEHPLPNGVSKERAGVLPAGAEASTRRVPRVTTDLLGARPIDLAVIEAIQTVSGGEGYWMPQLRFVEPKLLLVGRNPVCTDSVAAAVMGYDPQAQHHQFPFQGENHLRLAASVGVGTSDLERIEVRGLAITEARCPFQTAPAAAWRPVAYRSAYYG